jgi:TPR repeat protein
MYANGEGVEHNEERAKELFHIACQRADPIGCEAASQLARREPVP